MSGRTQQESEQPAKVYQLDAVSDKVDNALSKLDTLISQTSGLVTESQLIAAKKELTDYVDDEIVKVNLKYDPLKRNVSWFIKAIVGQGLVVVGGIIYLWLITK